MPRYSVTLRSIEGNDVMIEVEATDEKDATTKAHLALSGMTTLTNKYVSVVSVGAIGLIVVPEEQS